MDLHYTVDDARIDLSAEPDGQAFRIGLPDGEERVVEFRRLPTGTVEVRERLPAGVERVLRMPAAQTARGLEVSWAGRAWIFRPTNGSGQRTVGSDASGRLVAPMVGVVASVAVAEGERVEAHQALVVVEAMKVMATVEAPFAGRVVRVHVRQGDQVAHGADLVDVEPGEGP